jgi:glycosyltransferase involved in cell wall biosynthesis
MRVIQRDVRKILFLVTEDWYFCSHRLPIARAAQEEGFEVVVAARISRHRACIEEEGFRVISLGMRRSGKNILHELLAGLEILKIYWQERPDLVHHVALKPVIYGSLAAMITGVPVVINALAGLGFVFASNHWKAKLLKPWVRHTLRLLLNLQRSKLILQNPDDQRLLTQSGTVSEDRTVLIRGSGVDITRFQVSPEPENGQVVVALVARMLRDKGVAEFAEASRLLKRSGVSFRAILVGAPDPENPTSIPESQLIAWQSEGLVEWWGHRGDISSVWAQAHIAVLPTTYGEGVPKSLLEAAACGRPIIATDVPGCREIVLAGSNGLLVSVRDAASLSKAIAQLVGDRDLRLRMGAEGRKLVEQQFSESLVVARTLDLYRSMSGRRWPVSC